MTQADAGWTFAAPVPGGRAAVRDGALVAARPRAARTTFARGPAAAAAAAATLPVWPLGLVALALRSARRGRRWRCVRSGRRSMLKSDGWASEGASDVKIEADEAAGPRRPPSLPALSQEEQVRLALGEKVQRQERDGRTGWGFVVTDVHAPPGVVLECLEAFKDYPRMIPVVRHAAIHSQRRVESGSTLVARCTYSVSRFWLGISIEHKVEYDAGVVRFDLDKARGGKVLQECTGFWYVQPDPEDCGHSRIWLNVRQLRTHPLFPHWLVDYAAERALAKATDWLRPHAEQVWERRRAMNGDARCAAARGSE